MSNNTTVVIKIDDVSALVRSFEVFQKSCAARTESILGNISKLDDNDVKLEGKTGEKIRDYVADLKKEVRVLQARVGETSSELVKVLREAETADSSKGLDGKAEELKTKK